MYQKILVPLDGSKRAEAIIPHVVEMARHYDAAIILLQVVEPDLRKLMFRSAATGLEGMEEDFQRRYWAAQTYLNDLGNELRSAGNMTITLVENGPVVQRILETAQREDASLIAMSSHGRTGAAHAFYGSIAGGLLHQTHLPLLLIRSAEEGDK